MLVGCAFIPIGCVIITESDKVVEVESFEGIVCADPVASGFLANGCGN